MKYHRFLVPLLLLVALAGCQSAGAPAHHAATFGQDIQLAPKEQAVYRQPDLTVEFVKVVSDSRCPRDVTCVWAGEVKVELSIRIGAAEAMQREVTMEQSTTVGGFRVSLVQVEPERTSSREISPEEYRVTLRVEQLPG